ncbi:FecR domain-containing protein [Fulvivirgaceae bacterium BMA12]|uniref:FecR domain-containing protein n=1 Tax=Agaribacillus aureus TaxID=3051825 RepID=A0ABT8L4E5_9BACT|nr:FecR domain-containing protein [Fulvivirgaceae bacterium BMA12]
MHKDTLYDLFARYLVGKADQDDIEELQKWLEASEENKTFFQSITTYWDTELDYFKKDSDSLAQKLAERIKESDENHQGRLMESGYPGRPESNRTLIFSPKIAAAIAAFIIAGATVIFSGYFNRFINFTETENSVTYVERSTKPGEKLNVKLPDGSLVKLNSSSKLIFPDKFSNRQRKITLIGEAFFEVTKDPERPFNIKSGGISTTVLGTTFNIRAFPDEKDITVAVVSGRVAVESLNQNSKTILLEPDEMAIYSKENNQTVKSNFDYMEAVAWKDGIIYFKDANIYEILDTLEEWYGVSFKINRKLNREKGFTVSHKDKSLETILRGLSFSYGFQFEMEGKTININ